MKITKSVRRLFDDQLDVNKALERRVRVLFESRPEGWFYRGRIKPIESFAQKLETGRVDDATALEDFFACTLVVENRAAIQEAREFVERFCEIQYQRPPDPQTTFKRPEAFSFDDLRLYVRLKATGPEEPITEVLFEIQIKTFLQYAWGIATRDLIYKGDQISWGKARLAYQIKAMFEHAEISIAEVEAISTSGALTVTDQDTQEQNRVLEWLREGWDPDRLPQDRRRLVSTLLQITKGMHLSLDDLFAAVDQDTARGEGIHLRDLSPYGIVVRSLFAHQSTKVQNFLRDRNRRQKLRIFLTEEMEVGDLPANALPTRYHFVGGQDAHPAEARADAPPDGEQ
ncbi:MAG: hypothetical protein ABW277_03230 [Longimicrobiaceae bacterium]